MAIANGLSLPNPLSNGTTADAVAVMADYNYLLGALNRALLDSGGGAGVNAQSTQIHNLANGVAANDAVNLSQLGGYALLASSPTFTGVITGASLTINNSHLIYSVDATDIGIRIGAGGPFGKIFASGVLGLGFDASSGGPLVLSTSGTAQLTLNTSGSAVFAGPLSGITTLAMAGALSGVTSLAMAGALSGVTTLAVSGALTTGSAANSVGYLGTPQTIHSANYTFALADIATDQAFNGASLTATIPANASVAFPIGSIIVGTNLNASNLTIAITTDTLLWSGTTTTGSRTIGQNGEFRLRKIAATTWLITGTAMS